MNSTLSDASVLQHLLLSHSIAILVTTLTDVVPQAVLLHILFYMVMALKLRKVIQRGHEDIKHANTALRGNRETVAYTGLGTIWAIIHTLQILR